MRILLLYIEPAPYILDLIRVLRQRHPAVQLRVYFISSALTQNWETSLDGVTSSILPQNSRDAFRVMLAEISRGNFDVLHLAGWGHPLLLSSLICGSLFRRTITVESDTQLPAELSLWKKMLKKVVYPLLFSRVDLFFPGGTRQKKYFRHYHVPENKIRIAQMTVDVSGIMGYEATHREDFRARRAALGFNDDEIIFLYVGRLEIYKGIADLLAAFKLFGPERANARLLIIGDGSCRGMVEDAAGNDARILYAGRKNFQGVVDAYSIADVSVVPSLLEGWGLVVNEAMAAALPVIASDRVGCVDDLVDDGITGFIFETGNVEGLYQAMRKFMDNSGLGKRMGHSGRQKISAWRLEEESDILCAGWKKLNAGCNQKMSEIK